MRPSRLDRDGPGAAIVPSTARARHAGSSGPTSRRVAPDRGRRATALGVVAARHPACSSSALGIRPARCWDLGAVHRMLVGGWRCVAGRDLGARATTSTCRPLPQLAGAPDLFSDHEHHVDPDDPLDPLRSSERRVVGRRVDGRRHSGVSSAGRRSPSNASSNSNGRSPSWPTRAIALATAHSESAAEQLCAELEHDGLPIDLSVAEALIGAFIGPRPSNAVAAATLAAERDEVVLRHIPVDQRLDLRNPANVKALLRRVGIEVSDTRAWRLEELRRPASVRRRPARVAQGRARVDHVRLRVARRERRAPTVGCAASGRPPTVPPVG